jgi:hypothetical protein
MTREILAAVFFSMLVTASSADSVRIEGLIQDGIFLRLAGDEDVEFPLPYVGVFHYQPDEQLATFSFDVDFGSRVHSHTVGTYVTGSFTQNMFAGVLQDDSESLIVDFRNVAPPFNGEPRVNLDMNFVLYLDKSSGNGTWGWCNSCSPSDPGIVQAAATITSFSVIPEPTSFAIAVALAASCITCPIRSPRRRD